MALVHRGGGDMLRFMTNAAKATPSWASKLDDLVPVDTRPICPHCGRKMSPSQLLRPFQGDHARPAWHAQVYGNGGPAWGDN